LGYNAVIIDGSSIALDLGGSSVTMGTGLVVSRGANNSVTNGSIDFGGNDRLMLVEGLATDGLTVEATLAGTAGASLVKSGSAKLTLSGMNTGLAGPALIDQGTLKITNASALGASGATDGTRVSSGAILEIDGTGMTITEPLTVINGGQYDLANNKWPGAVRHTSTGTNSLTGTIVLETTHMHRLPLVTIGVDSGTLVVAGAINRSVDFINAASSLTKYGAGIMELTGATVNTLNGVLTVADGTLILNKPGAGQALPSGSLVVGDSRGGFRTDERVEYGTGAQCRPVGKQRDHHPFRRFRRQGLRRQHGGPDDL